MSGLKTARFLEKTGTYMTPAGRMMYASLYAKKPTAKGQTDTDKFRYQVTLLIPADADITALREAVKAARDEKWTAGVQKTTKIASPILKTEDYPRFAELAEEYPHYIRFKTNNRPGVINKANVAVSEADEADEVYDGRECRVTCTAFAYDNSGNKGVSLSLSNVQLLDHKERLAGGSGGARATDEFEAVGGDDLDDMVG